MRRIALVLVAAALLALGVACSSGTDQGSSTTTAVGSAGTTTSGRATTGPTGGGWTAFADVIPVSATLELDELRRFDAEKNEAHMLGLLDTTHLDELGFPRPDDDDELVAWLQDVSLGFGGTGSYDGLTCRHCGRDSYAEDWTEAFGYAPLGFDRLVLVGSPPGQLAVLHGGVDPDQVAAAFEGDEHQSVAREGDWVRVGTDCDVYQARCVDPSARDELGRGLTVAANGEWTVISQDPSLVDDTVALIDGDCACSLPDDSVERTALAWADDLDLLAGSAWAPSPDPACPSAPGIMPDATAALVGTTRSAAAPEVATLVYRVGIEDETKAARSEEPMTQLLTEGTGCATSTPFAEFIDEVEVTVEGTEVTVTAQIVRTVGASTIGTAPEDAVRGSIWSDLLLRQDLPFAKPAD